MAHPGGRPTDYRPEFNQIIDEYLTTTGAEQMKLPKVVDIAILLGVRKETLYDWAKIYPEFNNSLARVTAAQEKELVDSGLFGGKEVNASIAKLLLYNHGYREKSETDITSGGEKLDSLITYKPDRQLK